MKQTAAHSPAQFSLGDMIFVSMLTFLGMAVMNSVTFTDNPALGCVLTLIATGCGALIAVLISVPNSDARKQCLIVAVVTSWIVLGMAAEILPRIRFAEAFGLLCALSIPFSLGLLVGCLLFPAHKFTYHQRWKRRGLIVMTGLMTSPFFVAVLVGILMPRGRGCCSNQTAAAAACKAYAEAQEIHRRTDYDGDGVFEYAKKMYGDNSLLEIKDGAGDLLLIDPAFAEAAWEHPLRQPKAGYFFKVLCTDCDLDKDGNQTEGFALLAVPAAYGNYQKDSFMISHHGEIYQKDLGPQTLNIAASITEFAVDETWIPSE